MITTCEKKTNGKTSTAVNRSSKRTNGAASREAIKPSNQPIAPVSAPESKGHEPRPLPPVSEIVAKYYADHEAENSPSPEANSGLQQNNSAAATRAPRLPDVKQIEQLAIELGQSLGGNVAPRAQTSPSAAPRPVTSPAIVGDEFLEESLPTAILSAVLVQGLRVQVGPDLIANYLDRTIKECRVADNPLGRSLVEEFVTLKFLAASLHSQTLACKKPADLAVINAAGISVAAEMRRMAIVINGFRKN